MSRVEPLPVDRYAAAEIVTLRPPSAPDESTLVARAQAGDAGAFEALYRATAGRTYALCLRMTGSPSNAEELAQEAYVRAWQKLGTFRGGSAFSTWLHRLTVNVVLASFRARSSRPQPSVELDHAPPPLTAPTPVAAVDLERAIADLPERARTVFVLHDVEGYRHREIAEIAGMAEGTSKAHLNRARRLLREALS